MSTLYPNQIDSSITLPSVIDLLTPVAASSINQIRDAVLAIEGAIGVKPGGIYTNIRSRLDALEVAVSGAVMIAGDLGGTLSNPLVVGIQGSSISSTAPTQGQILGFTGLQWTPTSDVELSSATVANINSGSTKASLLNIQGKIVFGGVDSALNSGPNQGIIYYDLSENKFKVSENTSQYLDLSPIAAPVNGFRISITSGLSVPLTDATSSSNLYLTPHTSGYISLWNGSSWVIKQSSEISYDISTLASSTNYDVFVYNSGTIMLELVAWTNSTTRAVALSKQNGVLVKSTDSTRRYVGTIRTNSLSQVSDTAINRFVWNQYNQVVRELFVSDSTASWTTATLSAFRQVRATATNQVSYVSGDDSLLVNARSYLAAQNNTGNSSPTIFSTGIGIDSTSVNSGQTYGSVTIGTVGTTPVNDTCIYQGRPGSGYHQINWLEFANGAMQFLGLTNSPINCHQSGLTAYLMG